MKKNIFKKVIISFLVLLISLAIFGCGNENKTNDKVVNPINVSMDIYYPQKAEMDNIKNVSFTIEEDSSVLDMVQIYCNINNIPISIETTSSYVQGINGVMEGDKYGDNHIWAFTINDKTVKNGAADQILKDGDHVTWKYIETTK